MPSDANTSVTSERSNYFDLGLSHQLTPALTVGVDAFYRKVRNLQDEGQFGNALIYSAFNYDEGRIRGVEFSASYKAGDLSVYGNASVSKAEGRGIDTGQFNFDTDELAYIATPLGPPRPRPEAHGIGGRVVSVGRRPGSAPTCCSAAACATASRTPGTCRAYLQVNLSAAQTLTTPWLGKVEGRVAVINVFDRVYELRDGSGIGVGAPQYGPRRGFFVGATKYF